MAVLYLTEEEISFTGALVRGGAIHVRNVVEGLRERGIETFLVDWNDTPEQDFQYSIRPRVRLVGGALQTALRAIEVGREVPVDVVISKTRKTYLPGWIAARRLDVPHLVHVGSSLDRPTRGLSARFGMASFKARLRASHDGYLVVCDHIANQLVGLGVDPERIFDVKNAVDTERFHPTRLPERLDEAYRTRIERLEARLGEDALVLGYVGGLYDYKGIDDLATAIQRTDAPVGLVVAGDGPDREMFEAAVGDAGVFLGSVPYDQIPAVYHRMDAFVLPSHTEGLPRVVLEGQATGTPVVATTVGGIPEIVTDGETGLLCRPGDPDSIASCLERLEADSALRDRLAEQGREEVIRSYSWPQLYDRYERVLEQVVTGTDGAETPVETGQKAGFK